MLEVASKLRITQPFRLGFVFLEEPETMKKPVRFVIGMVKDFLRLGCPIQGPLLALGRSFRCNGSAMGESAKDPPKLRLNGAPKHFLDHADG
jgi:hypothetical protein